MVFILSFLEKTMKLIKLLLLVTLFYIAAGDTIAVSEVIKFTPSGEWGQMLICGRQAVYNHNSVPLTGIKTDILKQGNYQLFAYVYHNLRTSCPVFFLEATDSAGNIYRGSHVVENIWYLGDEQSFGRWFFISLTDGTYWELPKGKLELKLWVEARDSSWEDSCQAALNDFVGVDSIFLIPVIDDSFQQAPLSPESGRGTWQKSYYHPDKCTSVITSTTKGSTFYYDLDIPVDGYYKLWLSALSAVSTDLVLSLENDLVKHSATVKLKGEESWELVEVEPMYLAKGGYSLIFKNLSYNKVMVDFFVLSPVNSKQE